MAPPRKVGSRRSSRWSFVCRNSVEGAGHREPTQEPQGSFRQLGQGACSGFREGLTLACRTWPPVCVSSSSVSSSCGPLQSYVDIVLSRRADLTLPNGLLQVLAVPIAPPCTRTQPLAAE